MWHHDLRAVSLGGNRDYGTGDENGGEAQMTVWPAIAVFGTTVCIGIYMGWQYLMGVRNSRVLIGVHLLLGVVGLEVVAILVRHAFDTVDVPGGDWGRVAALALAAALFSGLMVPLLAPRYPRSITPGLVVHGVIGMVGFALLLAWALGF
jgi:hypothetical protein